MGLPPYAEMQWRTNACIAPGQSVWICPGNPRRSNGNNLFHYCLNEHVNGIGTGNQVKITAVRQPTATVWLFDNGGLRQRGTSTTGDLLQSRKRTMSTPTCTTTAHSLSFPTATFHGFATRSIGISRRPKASRTIQNWSGFHKIFTARDGCERISSESSQTPQLSLLIVTCQRKFSTGQLICHRQQSRIRHTRLPADAKLRCRHRNHRPFPITA
jgi:hypothetical protein